MRPHLGAGKLELIVLNADHTARLAAALSEQAYVVYWETWVHDEAARVLRLPWRSHLRLEKSHSMPSQKRVLQSYGDGALGKQTNSRGVGGPGNSVQKFDLDVDPKDATRATDAVFA